MIASQITKKITSVFRPAVILPALCIIFSVSLLPLAFPQESSEWFTTLKSVLLKNLGWFYNYAVVIFVLFVIFVVFSKWGKLKLGPDDSKPQFSYMYWASMILASGIGVGMMYFGTAELMLQYAEPALDGLSAQKRLDDAQEYTFFHWGIHGWSAYGIVGLTVAYFSFRYRLPLILSTGLYPILKERVNGTAGKVVDSIGICGMFFGMLSTLAFGLTQINSGLYQLHLVDNINISIQQLIIIGVLTAVLMISKFGPANMISRLSYVCLWGAFLLLIFVCLYGPFSYLTSTFFKGLGTYFSQFFFWTLRSVPSEPARLSWSVDYTMLYWVSFICWSPYLGLYIARISRGRTVREFLLTVLGIPAIFNFIWMSAFGGTGVWIDQHDAHGKLSALYNSSGTMLFESFAYLPYAKVTIPFAVAVVILFFILSFYLCADNLDRLSSTSSKNRPRWQFILWVIVMALSLSVLLSLPGMKALQSMSLLMAVFLAVILLLYCYGLIKDFRRSAR